MGFLIFYGYHSAYFSPNTTVKFRVMISDHNHLRGAKRLTAK